MTLFLRVNIFNFKLIEEFTYLSELHVHDKIKNSGGIYLTKNSFENRDLQIFIEFTLLYLVEALEMLSL